MATGDFYYQTQTGTGDLYIGQDFGTGTNNIATYSSGDWVGPDGYDLTTTSGNYSTNNWIKMPDYSIAEFDQSIKARRPGYETGLGEFGSAPGTILTKVNLFLLRSVQLFGKDDKALDLSTISHPDTEIVVHIAVDVIQREMLGTIDMFSLPFSRFSDIQDLHVFILLIGFGKSVNVDGFDHIHFFSSFGPTGKSTFKITNGIVVSDPC